MKTVFIQNLITPYRSRLFNIICSKSKDFGVYYMGLTEADRNWDPNNIDVRHAHWIDRFGLYFMYAKLGSRTIVVTGTHRFSPDGDCIEKEGAYKDVKICRGAVVSTGSIVLPGITIGEMAHVAAGSVVTKDVPPYTRVAGNPARPIRNLLTNERIG